VPSLLLLVPMIPVEGGEDGIFVSEKMEIDKISFVEPD
jgi:hypothetical protein